MNKINKIQNRNRAGKSTSDQVWRNINGVMNGFDMIR
jgi:hypothetical protein